MKHMAQEHEIYRPQLRFCGKIYKLVEKPKTGHYDVQPSPHTSDADNDSLSSNCTESTDSGDLADP